MKNTFNLAINYIKDNTAQAWLELLALACGVGIVALLFKQAQFVNALLGAY